MCMPYVNATMRAYYDIQMDGDEIVSCVKPFDLAEVEIKDGARWTPAFKIAIQLNVLGSRDLQNKVNPITNGDTLVFRLNMTQYADDVEGRNSAVLDFFERKIELKDCNKACFEFYNETRIVPVPQMKLPEGKGKFALKLFIMRKPKGVELEALRNSERYSIQAMKQLEFVDDIRTAERRSKTTKKI